MDTSLLLCKNKTIKMSKHEKLLTKILRGTSDARIQFSSLRRLLERLGFAERIKGDHHIFTKDGIQEILNLQPQGSKSKPYQVKQVRSIILRYKLELGEENDE